MSKCDGYAGTILRIDLTSRGVRKETLEPNDAEAFLGGEGLGARMLWNEIEPGVDPFSSGNKLIFAAGPLQGTTCPSANSRVCLVTKSPLTGYFMRSFAGAEMGYEMKKAGYDALMVEGEADEPVTISIRDEYVSIDRAVWLWGVCTGDTQKYLRQRNDHNTQIACIGPAGENLVRFASIVIGIGTLGRAGGGAVMGSKKLKAITVRGTKDVQLNDPDGFRNVVSQVHQNFKNQTLQRDNWRKYGTIGTVETLEFNGSWPTRNFQEGVFPESRDTLYPTPWRKNDVIRDMGCAKCPILCKKITYGGKTGPYAGIVAEGPEYETIWAFGPQCGNSNSKAITCAERYCDELGMDTISCGNAIGFAMEIYQRGIVSKKDTDGLDFAWGSDAVMVEAVRRIGYRIGFGDTLAEGVKRAAERLGKGADKYAMHVRGLEIPAYDPRGQPAMGLNYATANMGASHNSGFTLEELRGAFDRFASAGKAKLIFEKQNTTSARNSMILCNLGAWGTASLADKLLTAATGRVFTPALIDRIGERIFNLERAFNVREGLDADTLPYRLIREPLKEGPAAGHVVPLDPMLDDYYEIRGWDRQTGIPTRAKLEELGLNDVADELGLQSR